MFNVKVFKLSKILPNKHEMYIMCVSVGKGNIKFLWLTKIPNESAVSLYR